MGKTPAKVQDPEENNTLRQTRRSRANTRERTRMHELNHALEAVRQALPLPLAEGKLTKLEILRSATNYMRALQISIEEHDRQVAETESSVVSQGHCHGAASPGNMSAAGFSGSGKCDGSAVVMQETRANNRERTRTHDLNKALEALRKVHVLPVEGKLTKLETLRLTINYMQPVTTEDTEDVLCNTHRSGANDRERARTQRTRTHELNKALEALREVLPVEGKLTKLETLCVAINYIIALQLAINQQDREVED
nr:hypothetical protein BaRGS_003869 [Batillaria attramentaria]